MTLSDIGLKTRRGGEISIHFGKIVTTNLWDEKGWYQITDSDVIDKLKHIRLANKNGDKETQMKLIRSILETYATPDSIGTPCFKKGGDHKTLSDVFGTSAPVKLNMNESTRGVGGMQEEAPKPTTVNNNREKKLAVSTKLLQFFSEFAFDPAIRFVNTLANSKRYDRGREYISNYMTLCDHPDKDGIIEKTKSDEFKMICQELFECATGNVVNKRLEIYFGPAGTGKTTKAINKYPEAKVTVCNEMMDSTDLMKTFAFNDESGNPVFKPSSLQEDMINGKPHILDEMNLLPLSSLRYLQGILDGKKEIEFEGKTITIADGFKIIGTMNLIVNGQVFNLPEPIVDRASVLESYSVNPDILADYAF